MTRLPMSCVSFCRSLSTVPVVKVFLDDPEVFKGAPVGLQVVGRPQEEEAVIALTEIVAAALKSQETTAAQKL